MGFRFWGDGAVVDTGSRTGARAGTRLAARRRRVEIARGRTLCPLIRWSVASTSDCGGVDGMRGVVRRGGTTGAKRGSRGDAERRGAEWRSECGFQRVNARTTRTRTMFADRVSSSTRTRGGECPRAKRHKLTHVMGRVRGTALAQLSVDIHRSPAPFVLFASVVSGRTPTARRATVDRSARPPAHAMFASSTARASGVTPPARLARRAGFSLPRVASRVVVLPPSRSARVVARAVPDPPPPPSPRAAVPPPLSRLFRTTTPPTPPPAPPASSDPDATPTVSSSSDADPVPVPPRGGVVGWWRAYAAKSASMAAQIRAYGLAGLTAYGILNTVYYTVAFTAAWSFRSVPDASTTGAAFRAAGEVMALVWAGSQVTKLARFGIAIAAAPKIDGFIRAWCERSGWGYRRTFVTVTVGCFLGSAAFFAALIVAKAAST